MHEDMLFYRGECVTHWEIQVFLRFSGELVSFRELGQPDLYFLLYALLFDHEHHMSYGTSMCRVHPWTSRELNATLSGSR